MNFNSIKADANSINYTNEQLNNLKWLAFESIVDDDVTSNSDSIIKLILEMILMKN